MRPFKHVNRSKSLKCIHLTKLKSPMKYWRKNAEDRDEHNIEGSREIDGDENPTTGNTNKRYWFPKTNETLYPGWQTRF